VGARNPSRAINNFKGFSPQGVSHRDDLFEAANPSGPFNLPLQIFL